MSPSEKKRFVNLINTDTKVVFFIQIAKYKLNFDGFEAANSESEADTGSHRLQHVFFLVSHFCGELPYVEEVVACE